jgi:selenocysteine lyase/cysteine desulfurase
MLTRRSLVSSGALLAATSLTRPAEAKAPPPPPAPDDTDYWARIQSEFTLDRSFINLNNGGCSPSPRVVHEALKRYLDLQNEAPVHTMWNLLEPGIENVRRQLAAEAGCDPEEIAITRNSSEALQIAQQGLDLERGDEVLTTDQDYPRMLDTWDQRAARYGIVVKKLSFPVPLPNPQDFVKLIADGITPKTKVIHISHIVNITGQILPVKDVCDLARSKGIPTIVDGAHAFAHFPFAIRDLGCDYYGVSLHKWCMAPVGTGFLYVRKDRIAGHWGMQPTNATKNGDIRKFEEIGTHPAANHNAIAEALQFHQAIGVARKHGRLLALRSRWTEALRAHPRVGLLTPEDPNWSGGIGVFSVKDAEPPAITTALWDKYRILATPIVHAQFKGIRVTPSIYTTYGEIDSFVGAVRTLLA